MAIHMRREGLVVDPVACTGCRKCIDPCPVGALLMIERTPDPAGLGIASLSAA